MTRGLKISTRQALRAGLAALLLSTTGGCGTLYLHDSGRQENTAAARAALDTADPSAVFAAEHAHLSVLKQEEDRLVRDQVRATRDRIVAQMIVAPSPQTQVAWMRMQAKAGKRISSVLGPTDLTAPVLRDGVARTKAQDLFARDVRLNVLASEWRQTLAGYRQLWAGYRSLGGTNADPCHDISGTGSKTGDPDSSAPAAAAFVATKAQCEHLRAVRDISLADRLVDPAQASTWTGDMQPDLKRVEHQIWLNTETTRARKALADQIQADLKCLEVGYKAAETAAGANRTAETVSAWATATQDYLTLLDEPVRLMPETTASAAALKKSGCTTVTDAKPTVPGPGELLAAAGVGIDVNLPAGVRAALAKALKKQIPAAVAIQKRAFLDSRIGKLVTALASFDATADGPADDDDLAFAVTVIDTIESLRDHADATATPPRTPSLNALLVEQEYQRYLLAIAQAETARADARLTILKGQRQALETEVTWLAGAYLHAEDVRTALVGGNAACRGARDFSTVVGQCPDTARNAAGYALTAYTKAWNLGRAPYVLGEYAMVQTDRATALTLAQQTTETRQRLIAAALDELTRWGEGGLTRDQLIGLAQAIGIAVIGINTGDS